MRGFTVMGKRLDVRTALVLTGCLAALAVVPSAANATPGSGVSGTVLAQGTTDESLRITAKGRTDVVVRTLTIAPGGTTGWHHHPGQVLAVVRSGTLTRTLDDCSLEVTGPGGAILEPAGARHRHLGRNLGTEPVVLYVTYFLPAGSPLSVDEEAPDCAAGQPAARSGTVGEDG
ncbi:cupin domain-containing protein [Streptomyces pristinaespiralis]|uniref:cupin domain-containing protein n=1 Tax=Streptomyces pristinaespiralis TaxID=38300 RepID=UPI0033CF35E4